jgi:hypothetical protein
MEGKVSALKKELANTTKEEQDAQLPGVISLRQTSIDNMRDRCVQAFDPASELPISNSSKGETGVVTRPGLVAESLFPPDLLSCADRDQFPRNFTKLIANTRCGNNGVFRLPLAPGRYAVFIGWSVIGHSSSANPWWQFVDVKPHEWKQLIPPKYYFLHENCEQDLDCADGLVCRPSLGLSSKTCQARPPSLPPNYDSGVDGVVGPGSCGDSEVQCVEAFREQGDYMTACGLCAWNGAFKLPLAPGRYTLDFDGWITSPRRKTLTVEITPNRWKELYLLGAKPGQAPPQCSPHS